MRIVVLFALALGACSTSETLQTPKCPGATNAGEPAGLSVWDDGRSMFLHFPGLQMEPTINAIWLNGQERRVNTSTDPATGIVSVHGIFPGLILRDGERIACIWNNSFLQQGGVLPPMSEE